MHDPALHFVKYRHIILTQRLSVATEITHAHQKYSRKRAAKSPTQPTEYRFRPFQGVSPVSPEVQNAALLSQGIVRPQGVGESENSCG
jgi:hypothetical protein